MHEHFYLLLIIAATNGILSVHAATWQQQPCSEKGANTLKNDQTGFALWALWDSLFVMYAVSQWYMPLDLGG